MTKPGEPARFLTDVAFKYKGDDCLIWPFARDRYGYGTLLWRGALRIVSRVVCEHHHGAPPTPKHQAAHSCGKGHTGCISGNHLSWKTHAENHADKIRHGTSLRGEKNNVAKLTEADVLRIRSLRGVVTQGELAEAYGVCRTAVHRVLAGKTWGWL